MDIKSGWRYEKHSLIHIIYDRDGNESDRIEEECPNSNALASGETRFNIAPEEGVLKGQCDFCSLLVTLRWWED